ncbi:DUF3054 domain-containing protein [Leucobacter japonicus]|uniref:DUF3054 domain-containing protein n=1 Tax=Leucobacter japonicus TaxID=1461259 RepID=UPI0006A7EACE|nr:DUF3054 domain-containing protein [Leucobacter japonicus]
MSSTAHPVDAQRSVTRTVILAFCADIAFVLLFAGIGRSSHEREASLFGLFSTAWPFLVGLAITWLALRVARHPLSVLRAGVPVWIGTVVIGMLLRAATGASIAPAFIIVATITLAVFVLGWRAIAALVLRLRRRPA